MPVSRDPMLTFDGCELAEHCAHREASFACSTRANGFARAALSSHPCSVALESDCNQEIASSRISIHYHMAVWQVQLCLYLTNHDGLSNGRAVQIEEISLVESDKISMSAMAARMPGLQLLKDTLSGDLGAK